MREILARLRLPLLFATLLVLTLASMVADRRALEGGGREHSWWTGVLLEIAVPIQKLLTLPIEMTSGAWSRYVALVDLKAENEHLRERLTRLEEQNLQFREALVASGNLNRIVEMREGFEVPLLPSAVVGQDVSPWFRSVLLDRGGSHEVRSGMPVVTDRGLVGLVTATSPRAARAMLMLDRQSAVDGIVQRSRARGIVRGRGTGRLEFVLVVRGDDVQVGDVVITSGLGGVHPKGLRIGEVTEVNTDETELLHTATLRPAVDFGRLEQVFVMLHRGPTMRLLYEGEGDHQLEEEEEPTGGPRETALR
jgi:rod shape-determining protein MreC